MKHIFLFITIFFFFTSCEKEAIIIRDLGIEPDDISRIELRADHNTLLAEQGTRMEFYIVAYAKKEVDQYVRNSDKTFSTQKVTVEFEVPKDQLPKDYFKVYKADGTLVNDNLYYYESGDPGTDIMFYARGGSINSAPLGVTLRNPQVAFEEEFIIPVVFHLLLPPPSSGPNYEISTQFLEEQIARINEVFNRKIKQDPNGGNLKVRFQLAEYDNNGLLLQDKGKNIDNISVANMQAMGTSSNKTAPFKEYILKNKTKLIWDPNKYLNIWLTKFTASTSVFGTASYVVMPPTVMHSNYNLTSIPGLKNIKYQNSFSISDITDCLQAGVMINYMSFFNPSVQGANDFNIATVLGEYYGLLQTYVTNYNNLNPDGDNDYCPDTYSYSYSLYPSVFKGNNLTGQPEDLPNRPRVYFTSFNVMDVYSRKSSISVDQANRMRKVLVQCPSRWAYKSSWAFTGSDN